MSLRQYEAGRPGGKKAQLEKRNPTQDLKVHLLSGETKRLQQWQKQTGWVYYVCAVTGGTTAPAVLADSF